MNKVDYSLPNWLPALLSYLGMSISTDIPDITKQRARNENMKLYKKRNK